MRIGILTESFDPVQNGVSTSVLTVLEELRKLKHHVYVFAPHFPDHNDLSPNILRVPSIVTPLNPDYPLPYPWFPRLRREIPQLDLDVLHTQTPFFLGLLGARIAKKNAIPLVSTFHTLYTEYSHYLPVLPNAATTELLEWWLPSYYNRCQAVITPSHLAEQSLRRLGVESPITVIPTGVPLPPEGKIDAKARAHARNKLRIPPNDPMILYVGRIAKEKNLDLLLNAFSVTLKTIPNAWLVLVGLGPALDEIRGQSAALGIADRTVFTGPTPRAEIDPIYAAADIFTFPSTTETQGLVVAEARAAGLPSIVANRGGAPQQVKHGVDGWLAEPDIDSFVQTMIQLLTNRPMLEEFRRNCRLRAPLFTPTAMVKQILVVYQQVSINCRKAAAGAV